MKTALMALCVAGFATAAVATPVVPKDYAGAGGPLADFAQNTPGVSTFSIVVPGDPDGTNEIFSIASVTLDITHTFVGDLVISLRHDDTGTIARLLDRPGVPPGTFGNGDDLSGVYAFSDGLTAFPENAGGAGGIVAPGTYGTSGPTFLFAFEGESKEGTWTLIIEDHAGGDTGNLSSWGLTINNVPAPSALALLGLGGLTAMRRRR